MCLQVFQVWIFVILFSNFLLIFNQNEDAEDPEEHQEEEGEAHLEEHHEADEAAAVASALATEEEVVVLAGLATAEVEALQEVVADFVEEQEEEGVSVVHSLQYISCIRQKKVLIIYGINMD